VNPDVRSRGESSLRNVLIFRKDLLAISETFVLAQLNSLKRYAGVFFGINQAIPSLALPANAIFLTRNTGLVGRMRVRWYRLTGWAPFFHSKAKAARADLIHAHFAIDGVIALPLAQATGLPLVVTLHGFDVTVSDAFHTSAGGKQYVRMRSRLWERAGRFLCVSEYIRQKAIDGGFPVEKLEVHYIGIHLEEFRFRESAPKSKVVLFVGRMVEKKGLPYLIHAMQLVLENHPDAQLRVIGTGPLLQQCVVLAKELKVAVQFLGPGTSVEVRRELQQAAVFCVPSVTAQSGDSEGLPIVVLEAMAMGVPVVASRHAGIPEAVIDGETGLLTEEKDAVKIAESICSFFEDPGLAGRCTIAAAQRVCEQFDLQEQSRKLELIYDSVCRSSMSMADKQAR
jgi:colanic acid/amylovoran biosynthesis glycosyltransferase